MKHRTQTTVKHWIDLDEREQFDYQDRFKTKPVAVQRLIASVVDGSLKTVDAHGRWRLKSGDLGMGTTLIFYKSKVGYDKVLDILRAHGIQTPDVTP